MNIEDTTDDLISFLDSEIWLNFKQIIPETGKPIKNNLINEISVQLLEGKMTIEGVFQNFNYIDLVNSFLSSPNIDFIYICLEIYPSIQIIQIFLENIFINSPNTIINCLDNATFSGNYDIMTKIANITIFLFNFNPPKTAKLREILLKLPAPIVIKEIFTFLNDFQLSNEAIKFNKRDFILLIQKVYSKSETFFWNIVKNSVNKENTLLIDLLKESVGEKTEFQIFIESLNFSEENDTKNKEIIFSIPDLLSFFERTNQIHQSLIDLYESNDQTTFNYLIRSIEKSNEYSQTSKINFLNKLRALKMIPISIDIENLNINLNVNDHVVSIDQVIEYIERSTVGCEQFANKLFNIFHLSFMEQTEQTIKSFCDQFYQKYIYRLQFQTLDKLAEISIDFLKSDLIQQHRSSLSALAIRLPISKYITKLFFNEGQIRSNLKMQKPDYNKNVQKNVMKEVTILENLHIAAIQTCNSLKLNSSSSFSFSQKMKNTKKNSKGCSLNLISNDSQFSKPNSNENSYCEDRSMPIGENLNKTAVVVGVDRKLILRLRWRTLRDDTSSICAFLPEFIQLCESDEKLFLKWEATCFNPYGTKRSQILMKLGISNNGEIISPLLFELLKIEGNIDDNLLEILTQVFSSNVDYKSLKIPENPNLSILFRFNFLWCTAVMCHPQICKVLRNPTKEISLSLLRSLLQNSVTRDYMSNNEIRISDFSEENDRNTKLFDQLFTTFPLGFSAIISRSSSYNSVKDANRSKNFLQDLNFVSKLKKPPQISLAEQILNGQKKPSKSLPRYLVVSVAFEFAKRKDLIRLAELANGDQNWIFYCFFFSICFNDFDISLSLIKKFDFLFDFLHRGVNEENLFVGSGKWTDGLIQFYNYCSSKDISFEEHRSWILLNDISQNTLRSSNSVSCRKDNEIKPDDDDWMSKDPINQSNSSSPLSSQNSCNEHNFSNPN